MSLLEPDRDQLEIFIGALFCRAGEGGYVSLRSFLPNSKVLRPIRAVVLNGSGSLIELADVAEDQARRAANNQEPAVFCPPIAIFNSREGWQAREEDLHKGLALSVECDQDSDQARWKLEELLGPATAVVRSGGTWLSEDGPKDKLHIHFRLKTPAVGKDELAKLKQARRLATAIAGADPTNIPAVHCLRWPGSWHRKGAPRLCEIVTANPDAEIDLDAALEALASAAPAKLHRAENAETHSAPSDWAEPFANIIAGTNLHHSLTRLAARWIKSGMSAGAAVNSLRGLMDNSAARQARPDEWLSRYEDVIRSVESAKRKYAEPAEDQKPEAPWDEPDWSLLDDRRGALPAFPLHALGTAELQDWVHRAAHGAGVSDGHVAVPLLGIASSLIGTARRVQASRSWFQPLTLWAALVGFSGSGKTPAIDATKRALVALERMRKPKIDDLRRTHEARVETAKLMQAQWKDQLKTALEDGAPPPPKPPGADEIGKFVTPRLYISNATIERLGVLLQARPQGLLMLADELAGLFLNMARYTTGQDNEFWLEAWNGNPYVIERMSRPAISLDYLLIGIAGGLQPDKLAKCFEGDEDGMYARILFAWPEEPDYQPLSNSVAEVEPEIVNALARLAQLAGDDPEGPIIASIPLDEGATQQLEQLRQDVFAGKFALDSRERDWWAKMPAHALRLAGTLCYLNWAMTGGPEPKSVDVTFVCAAVHLVREYFWPHARAALRLIGLSEGHAEARRVLLWIKSSGRDSVSLKDIRRDALAHKLDADETQQLMQQLERAGWLRKMVDRPGPWRPTVRWHVNPQLIAEKS